MKEKMMRLFSRKLIIGLAAGVAVIGVTTVIVAAMVSGNPWKRVKDSVEKTVGVLKEQSFVTEGKDLLDNGSVEVSMNTKALTFGLLNVDISAKWYSALKERTVALVAGAAMNGTPFLDASVKLDEQKMVVSSETLLDEIYGMEIKTSSDEDIVKAFEAFWEVSGKKIEKYLVDVVSVEETEGTMSYNTEDIAFDEIAFSADEEGIAEFLYNTAVCLRESEEFAQLVDVYAQAVDPDETVKTIYDTLDDIINNKEELKKELAGAKLCVRFLISEEEYLICINTEAEYSGEQFYYSVNAGPAPDRMSEISLLAETKDEAYCLSYTAEKNTEESYLGRMQFLAGEDEMAVLVIEKNSGKLKINLSADGKEDAFVLSGTVVTEENGSEIVVEELLLDSVEYDLGIGITIKKDDSIPEIPECTEILPMEPESLERITEDLTEELQNLLSMFW